MQIVGRGFSFEDLKVGLRFRTHRRTITEARLASKGERGLVRFSGEVKNQRGEVVLAYSPLRLLKKK